MPPRISSLANVSGEEVAKLLNIFRASNRHFVPFPFYPDKSFLSPLNRSSETCLGMASHWVRCCAVVIRDSPPDFTDVGTMPREAYDSAFSPLAANPPQDQHHGGRRGNRDTTKGTGAEGGMGEPARAPGQGLHGTQWRVLAAWPDAQLAPPEVQKLADTMIFGDLCFKNLEDFLYTGLP